MGNNLRKLRLALEWTHEEAAERSGMSRGHFIKLERGERELTAPTIRRIAKAFGVDVSLILDEGPSPPQAIPVSTPARVFESVMIIGEVAAGVWSEPSLSFEPVPTDIPRDPRWPAESVYLLRIRGSSVNKKAADGDLVLCLDYAAAPRRYRNGDWVIVERERGGLVETTVKKVAHTFNGEWMLEPESDDPQHQSVISLRGTDDYTTRVKAFVLDFIREGTRF